MREKVETFIVEGPDGRRKQAKIITSHETGRLMSGGTVPAPRAQLADGTYLEILMDESQFYDSQAGVVYKKVT